VQARQRNNELRIQREREARDRVVLLEEISRRWYAYEMEANEGGVPASRRQVHDTERWHRLRMRDIMRSTVRRSLDSAHVNRQNLGHDLRLAYRAVEQMWASVALCLASGSDAARIFSDTAQYIEDREIRRITYEESGWFHIDHSRQL